MCNIGAGNSKSNKQAITSHHPNQELHAYVYSAKYKIVIFSCKKWTVLQQHLSNLSVIKQTVFRLHRLKSVSYHYHTITTLSPHHSHNNPQHCGLMWGCCGFDMALNTYRYFLTFMRYREIPKAWYKLTIT